MRASVVGAVCVVSAAIAALPELPQDPSSCQACAIMALCAAFHGGVALLIHLLRRGPRGTRTSGATAAAVASPPAASS
ncbi:hypothetical protein OsI_28050 [Oryza sativa Indica Group]|uniref:Uncharacterized protein n=1 Tax=Oryza sativa subsp. indica TaxID=39946 RepID=A2YRV2_ORYSI|nr:hypothetical protein OsI_28050 [Oryza sativa Indica Group]